MISFIYWKEEFFFRPTKNFTPISKLDSGINFFHDGGKSVGQATMEKNAKIDAEIVPINIFIDAQFMYIYIRTSMFAYRMRMETCGVIQNVGI